MVILSKLKAGRTFPTYRIETRIPTLLCSEIKMSEMTSKKCMK